MLQLIFRLLHVLTLYNVGVMISNRLCFGSSLVVPLSLSLTSISAIS